ncbi:MAG TPA: amino acid permease [Candidatus Dormibacteraeota bacterium]|nr:amino acid permease [Candidatus Dormibacteraeota bacterium]
MAEPEALADDQILAGFGYRQELRRALRLFSLFAVAFSIISITTGIFTNYGFGLAHMGPAFIWTWPVAVAGQLLVGLVVSELGTRIPLAGYSYQWGSRLVNPAYGWFVGFTGLAYLSVGAAAINFVVVAPLWAVVLGLDPTNPNSNLIITLVLLAAPLAVNLVSIWLASRINNVAVFTELVGTVVVALVLVVLALSRPAHPLGFLFSVGGEAAGGRWPGQLPFAFLIGIFTIVGFELAADLSEEAINARVTVPKAIIWSILSSGALGMIALIGFTIAIPDLGRTIASPVPLAFIIEHWLGRTLTGVFLLFVVFSIFALTVVGTAATARLIFSMARDNILPLSGLLRQVHPRTRTPVNALLATVLLALLFTLFGWWNASHGGSAFAVLVTATATLPFLVYLGTVLAYAHRRPQLEAMPGAFRLGRWAGPVMYLALGWIVFALLLLTVPGEYRGADLVCLLVEAVAAVWYLAVLRRRFAEGTAGVTPAAGAGPEG